MLEVQQQLAELSDIMNRFAPQVMQQDEMVDMIVMNA